MAACSYPPLVTPQHYNSMFKVDVLLHEPTLTSTSSAAEIELDMIALCMQLDILCKKELVQHPSHKIDSGKISTTFVNKANVIIGKMKQILWKDHSRSSSPFEYIEESGIKKMFPRAAAYLQDTSGVTLALKPNRLDEYLGILSQLHQLSALSEQIKEDIGKQSRPKYLAHQLALLHQSLSSLPNGQLTQQKKSIEENFKAVKNILMVEENQDQPLPDDIREWVWELTNQISHEVESLPTHLTQPVLLPAYILSLT